MKVNLRLTPLDYDNLKTAAQRSGLSVNGLLNRIVRARVLGIPVRSLIQG